MSVPHILKVEIMKSENPMQFLVIGGQGKTGKRVVEHLQKMKLPVRSISRQTSPAFDWNDSSGWAEALHGADVVYATYQPDLAAEGAVEAVTALAELAFEQGVKKIVLLSGRGEEAAAAAEQALQAASQKAGKSSVIVRAAWFMQNFTESFLLDGILHGEIILPLAGNSAATEPFIDADDIADIVVAAMIDDKHDGKIYEITGSDLLNFEQITDKIAAATGKTVRFSALNPEDFRELMQAQQVSDELIDLLIYLFVEGMDGRNSVITHDVEHVLGRKPRAFDDYVQQSHSLAAWQAQ